MESIFSNSFTFGDGCPKTSTTKDQRKSSNIPEEWSSQIHCSGNLKYLSVWNLTSKGLVLILFLQAHTSISHLPSFQKLFKKKLFLLLCCLFTCLLDLRVSQNSNFRRGAAGGSNFGPWQEVIYSSCRYNSYPGPLALYGTNMRLCIWVRNAWFLFMTTECDTNWTEKRKRISA